MIEEMTPREFAARAQDGASPVLLDVREEWELGLAQVDTALHIPMGRVPERLDELERDREIVVMCRSGGRSAQVAHYLKQQGFQRVWNLAGGIIAWSEQVDSSISPY
jgi:rhodanese-related sulfurtransferase